MATGSTECDSDLLARLETLILKAEDLCLRCNKNSHVHGITKLRKKCQAEKKFLQGIRKKGHVKAAHLASSNLSHLEGVVNAVESLPNVTMTLQPFHLPGSEHPLCVDVVCNHGFTWVKVIARKAQALHLVWAGQGQFGEKSIVDQGTQFLRCAELWPVNFAPPKVVMIFLNGITQELKDKLAQIGIHCQGAIHEVDDNVTEQLQVNTTHDFLPEQSSSTFDFFGVEDDGDEEEELLSAADYFKKHSSIDNENSNISCQRSIGSTTQSISKSSADNVAGPSSLKQSGETDEVEQSNTTETKYLEDNQVSISSNVLTENINYNQLDNVFSIRPEIELCNLDVSTLICLVTNLCHGNCDYEFDEDILTQQAIEERAEPLLPGLESFLKGKRLVTCSTAVSSFKSILDIIGGPSEKERAEKLLQTLEVVPDSSSERSQGLKTSAKVKDRAKVIFGTGDTLRAITVSANHGFVRAAINQGITFAVHLHGFRALTEQKEATAKRIS